MHFHLQVLENRTKASHKEMAQIDELEELREINARHAKVDTDLLIEKQRLYEEHLLKLQQEEEDQFIEYVSSSLCVAVWLNCAFVKSFLSCRCVKICLTACVR